MTHTFRAKKSGVEIQVHEIVYETPILWRVALAPGVVGTVLIKSEWDRISPLPTEDGWYESEQYPIADGRYFPYRLREGRWMMDATGTPLSEEYMINRMPLHRLGRIDTKESGQ